MRRSAGIALLLLLLAGCKKRETPEAAIRRLLDDCVDALEKQDVGRAARHLSPSYQDGLGRSGGDLRLIATWALRRGPVLVSLRDTRVAVSSGSAVVHTQAWAIQGRAGAEGLREKLIDQARAFNLTIALAHEEGAWRVRSVDGDGIAPGRFE